MVYNLEASIYKIISRLLFITRESSALLFLFLKMLLKEAQLQYCLHQVVFARCQNYKPWPAEIIKAMVGKRKGHNQEEYLYQVQYIGHPSYSEHCLDQLEKFNQETVKHYRSLYRNTQDKEEKQILKCIDIAYKRMKENETKVKLYRQSIGLALPQNASNKLTAPSSQTAKDSSPSKVHNKSNSKSKQAKSPKVSKSKEKAKKEVRKEEVKNDIVKEQTKINITKEENRLDVISEVNRAQTVKQEKNIENMKEEGKEEKINEDIKGEPMKSEIKEDLMRQEGQSVVIKEEGTRVKRVTVKEKGKKETKKKNDNLKRGPVEGNLPLEEPRKLYRLNNRTERGKVVVKKEVEEKLVIDLAPIQNEYKQENKKAVQAIEAQLAAVQKIQQKTQKVPQILVQQPIKQSQKQQQYEYTDDDSGQPRRLNFLYTEDKNKLDSLYDEFAIEDGNYLLLLRTLKFRQEQVNRRKPELLIELLNKYLGIIMKHLKVDQKGWLLTMKRKQILMAIFECPKITIQTLIRGNSLTLMLQLVQTFNSSHSCCRKDYTIEYELIKSKLRIYLFALSKGTLSSLKLTPEQHQNCLKLIEGYKTRVQGRGLGVSR